MSVKSNLYQIFSAGSSYVHTEFTKTCPTAHEPVCNRDRPDKFLVQFSTESDPTSEDDGAGHSVHAPPFGP